MPPKCRACVECQISKRGCVTTIPGDVCDRCAIAIPPLRCFYKHSTQGTRNDLFSGSRLVASQLVSFEKPAPDSTCEPAQKMSSHPKTLIVGNEPPLATHHGMSLHNFISSSSSDDNIFRIEPNGEACSGKRMIFEVVPQSNILRRSLVSSSRVKVADDAITVGFVQSTQMLPKKLGSSCTQCLIAFRDLRGESSPWYLGIVGKLFHRMKYHEDDSLNHMDGMLSVYRWTGGTQIVDGCCVPSLFLEKDMHGCSKHLNLDEIEFKKYSGLQFCFLNQICGTLPHDGTLAHDIINKNDDCLQCSPDGPDIFPTRLTRIKKCPPAYVSVVAQSVIRQHVIVENTKPKKDKKSLTFRQRSKITYITGIEL